MRATIFALSSGAGRAGIAVVRVSGPDAGTALDLIGGTRPPARRAALRTLRDQAGDILDRALVLWLPGPESATGDDVAEFHVHGGPSIIAALLRRLGEIPGLRPAEPGEFTRRAFDNGRLDLTQVEGLADLLAADTDAQRRQAQRQFDGALGQLFDGWRRRLVRSLAHFEAAIDFVDEDLPEDLAQRIRPEIKDLADEMRAELGHRGAERLRDGLSVVILGAPNVGKSSLLNRLARREVAIVSATAGTTRDIIEVHLDLDGLPVTIADTAGLRDSGDDIEREGIRRALARADQADLTIRVVDAAHPEPITAAPDVIWVANKADLGGLPPVGALALSAKTGDGIDQLLRALNGAARARIGGDGMLTRARHRRCLQDCLEALDRFIHGGVEPELAAEDLRLAARALGRVTGRIDVEDLLDVIFAEFCIGK